MMAQERNGVAGAAPRGLTILSWIGGLMFAAACALVWFYAPREAVMGDVQRVFYFHVSSAWIGALAFLTAAAAGVAFLARGGRGWDHVGVASVEVGIVFSLAAIISGSIWARPIWNTWWTWDPRLVTTTVMVLLYSAYVMLRQGIEDPDRRARFGAVYAVLGFLSVPLTFLSIRIFRTIHPVVIGGGDPAAQGAFDMSPRMLAVFVFSLMAFTVLYLALLWHRTRLQQLSEVVDERRLRALGDAPRAERT
jgi:heme exporter protein C